MARILTASMANALMLGKPRGLFVSIDHPDGTGYFVSGVRSREWNGQTWRAAGTLGTISPMKRTSEIAIQDIEFRMSGLDLDLVSGLNDDVRNRVGSVWLACFESDDTVIRDPYKLIESELDFQTYEVADDGTTTIAIIAHAGLYTLGRGVEEAWTPENQHLLFPGDTGLDMIPSLQNQDLQWTPS